MKIHEYNEMMAYLTRPKLKDGTPLEKDFPDMSNTEIIETTEDQNTLIPPSKPQRNPNETLQAQIAFIKEVSPGLEPESQIIVRKNFLDKALQKGLITEEDYNSQLQPLMGKTGEELTKMLENFENMVEQDVSEK